jgi:hypothetical protein
MGFPRSWQNSVLGMRSQVCGLYAHASERMRRELTAALHRRWEDSLKERAAISRHSPVAQLDELLGRLERRGTDMGEKMISQIPPKLKDHPTRRAG